MSWPPRGSFSQSHMQLPLSGCPTWAAMVSTGCGSRATFVRSLGWATRPGSFVRRGVGGVGVGGVGGVGSIHECPRGRTVESQAFTHFPPTHPTSVHVYVARRRDPHDVSELDPEEQGTHHSLRTNVQPNTTQHNPTQHISTHPSTTQPSESPPAPSYLT